MSLKTKLLAALIVLLLLSNYSRLIRRATKTARTCSRLAASAIDSACTHATTAAQVAIAAVDLVRIDETLRQYHLDRKAEASNDNGEYFFPDNQERFEALLRGSKHAKDRDPALDHWRHRYGYIHYRDGYRVTSPGPNGLPDTEDDIWIERHGDAIVSSHTVASVTSKVAKKVEQKVGRRDDVKPPACATPQTESTKANTRPLPPPDSAPPADATCTQTPTQKTQPNSAEADTGLSPQQQRQALFWLRAGKNMALNADLDKARSYYKRVNDSYPDTPYGEEARRRLKSLSK